MDTEKDCTENAVEEEKGNEKEEQGEEKEERGEEKEGVDGIDKKEDFEKELLKDFAQEDDRKNTYIQYRIIHNYGVMAGDDAKIESIRIREAENQKKGRKEGNIFEDKNELSNWLLENYDTYSMALMIATAAFDTMPYMWVIQAADRLYELFDQKEEKEQKYGITDTLGRFGAVICQGEMNTYTGKTSIEIICLSKTEYQEIILKYIWKECPKLHDKIMNWLKQYSIQRKLSMSKRAVHIMGQLACWDYYYFLNSMVRKIREDKSISTDMVIAQIVIALNAEAAYQKNVHSLLQVWSKEHNVHYLLTGLFVCAELKNEKEIQEYLIGSYVQNVMREIREKQAGEYLFNLYDFFGVGMRSYTFYRILTGNIRELLSDRVTIREQRDVCELFLRLFAADIRLTRFEDGENTVLVNLSLLNNDVGKQIRFLWQKTWQCGAYRQIFYSLMVQYDIRLQGSTIDFGLERFIDIALGDVCTEAVRKDICSKVHRRIRK